MKLTPTQRMMLLIFSVCAAPFVLGTLAYFYYKPEGRINYGELLEVKPITLPTGLLDDGKPFDATQAKNTWWILHTCGADCDRELYATRQARTMLNKEMDRVQRLVLVAQPPPAELKAKHPDAQWIVGARQGAPRADRIMLIDPRNNQVLAWPKDPDIKRVNKDMARLLRVNNTR